MALLITITDAGRAEIINADNTGTGPVVITEIGFGTGQYAPSKAQTALTNEVTQVSSIAGLAVAADTIHVMAKDEGPDAYNVGEFGLYSASGTLVAVYSQEAAAGWIIQKAGASTLLLAVDIILESLDAASLTFGDVTFINPPATTETPGVVQLENSLTSPSTTKALTAAQGKKLQDEKAPLASPALTGTPTAPTAAQATNNTQLATTAFVKDAIAALIDSSPGALDTLNELAAALGDDPNFATTMTTALAGKQPLDATLTALADLATAADKLIYSTGSDAFATTTLTAKARTFLASIDEAAMRTFLALVKQTSASDATTGAVLLNGAWGIGGGAIVETVSANNIIRNGLYVTTSAAQHNPGANGAYILAIGNGSNAVTHFGQDVVTGKAYMRKLLSGTWSAWVELWHSGNLTPVELSPPGAVVHFARSTAPSGWLKSNGAAVSRTAYAALFAAIGTTFGAGDGSTTFNLPDLRGELLRGWDDGRGVDDGRSLGSAQSDAFQIHGFAGTVAYSLTLHSVAENAAGLTYYNNGGGNIPTGQNWDATVTNNDSHNTSKLYMIADGSAPRTAAETRPRNIALLACIKY